MLKLANAKGFEIIVVVESTGNTRYFKNRVEKEGIAVRVVNTMKFKVVNESVNKTDKRDAKIIAEFAQKDMLPEARLCSEKSEQLRRITKARSVLVNTRVKLKNQIHGILLGLGIKTKSDQFQSRKGRQEIIKQVTNASSHKVVEVLANSIEDIEKNIKQIETEMEEMKRMIVP